MNRLPRLHLVCALALVACTTHVTGNGVLGVEQRTVPPFDEVAITLGIEATVTAGAATQELTISGDENLLQYILTPVESGVLKTRLNGIDGIESVHPLRITAKVLELHAVHASGASRVDVKGAGSTEAGFTFEVGASEASGVQLQGPGGGQLLVVLSGGSALDAYACPVAGANVVLSGSSTLRINSAGEVAGSATGASTVEITGGGTCAALVLSGSSTCQAH